ncbi:hypothetical protein [Dyella caseinilytica]|uniref:Lipoprotein n=1 Tax=Dyella caseinilytica TaxID=1849581 RepID=A0ABX7GQ07_9GAMM|nr:hypothetical protein [Dyella caseinilytica]QRN52487.1 hypothetical protein ISN74_13510 [Dyella caseinilytica]GGA06426.1 hypothetical protein GCM10011408_29270 [Dyella caseinilytica]
MKRTLLIAAAALLSACGGQVVHAPAPIGDLVKPGMAPWLTVAGGPDKLEVRGLDHKLILEPSPDLARAVQSQLGAQLQPSYFQDLVMTCSALDTALRVDEEKAPGELGLDMTLHCSIWARGFDTQHDYKVHVSAPVTGGATDQGYAQTLPSLLADGSNDMAIQLRGDLQKFAQHPR